MAEASSASSAIPATSEIPFFSSLHGRQRRAERDIDVRDLKAAVKYGVKHPAQRDKRTGERRWRYTYADVVYITDSTSKREISSWVAPIGVPAAKLTLKEIGDHERAKERLLDDPSLCTSHTVIVVDQSGSMRTTDVADFYDRSRAVFGMLALDFVAKPRLSGERTDTDVVSLVLMQDSASIAIEKEPMGLVLYNQLVHLHDTGYPQFNGNFLPALDLAEQLLKSEAHSECGLSLLFFSDGRPSDHTAYLGAGSYLEAAETITDRVHALAENFGEQLTVTTLGFANPDQDFTVLENMAEAARDGGAQGQFIRPELSSKGLGTAIADSVSSLTATRLRLTTLAADSQRREIRHVEREAAGTQWDHALSTAKTAAGYVVYTTQVRRYEYSPDAMMLYSGIPWAEVGLFSEEANGIAIRSRALGDGAERLVFGLQELNSRGGDFLGPEMVAKESKHTGAENYKIGFHVSFARTQRRAQRIANKFNQRVIERLTIMCRPDGMPRVWKISFLSCSVYTFLDGGAERSVLAEKRLVGRYTKFNGNNGYVHEANVAGAAAAEPARGPRGGRSRVEEMMGVIDEGDEEESDSDAASCASDDGDDSGGLAGTSGETTTTVAATTAASGKGGGRGEQVAGGGTRGFFTFDPEPESYVQAFSHFSYRYTRRKMLVCDLQGVQSTSAVGEDHQGVFELTDPVIHYRSESGRQQVYGRTDFGKKGMHKFFETHFFCNDVCRLLGLAS